jgi:hypothetical protein
MKRVASIMLAIVIVAGGLFASAPAVLAVGKTPCDFTLALPWGAHYGPASGVLPARFRLTAKRCAKYAKAHGRTVQVSYPVMDSTVAIWMDMMADEIHRHGVPVSTLDENNPDCPAGENICGSILQWG